MKLYAWAKNLEDGEFGITFSLDENYVQDILDNPDFPYDPWLAWGGSDMVTINLPEGTDPTKLGIDLSVKGDWED